MTYAIIGHYNGNKEILDYADSHTSAVDLANEYIIAYGNDWYIEIQAYEG